MSLSCYPGDEPNISVLCFRWVFVYEKAYQVRDTAIESSVMTKVKGFGVYNDKVMDVADYVTPTQVSVNEWMDGR